MWKLVSKPFRLLVGKSHYEHSGERGLKTAALCFLKSQCSVSYFNFKVIKNPILWKHLFITNMSKP